MSKQSEFRAAYPGVHATVCDFYPDFNYRVPATDREVIADMRDPRNCCGHQQRAVTIWHAIEQCGPTDLGLDIGSHRGLTPYCIHVDKFYDGKTPHPIYGGVISADVVADGTELDKIFPPNTFPYVCSNHSLEHMPGDIVDLLSSWLRLLRPGGVLAMVVPDADFWDVKGSDPDHKTVWGHSDFRPRVLDPLLARGGVQLVDFDTLNNRFSFDVILRKT
jgi:SAM-dependent methyltransferase